MAVGLLGSQVRDQSDAAAATRMMNVNFTWPVAALTEARNRLVAQGSGRILVMSSVGAVRVRSSAYLYGGAKAGLDRLCQGMADSLAGTGVTSAIRAPRGRAHPHDRRAGRSALHDRGQRGGRNGDQGARRARTRSSGVRRC